MGLVFGIEHRLMQSQGRFALNQAVCPFEIIDFLANNGGNANASSEVLIVLSAFLW